MAGVYGEINSWADYHRVLREATNLTRRLLAASPTNVVMQVIQKQLEAMKRWTDNGRDPTESERTSIDVGLIAVRELSEADGAAQELSSRLMALNSYFEDWPTDEKAASATDDDFFEGDEDDKEDEKD
jgi:hypothetical protein